MRSDQWDKLVVGAHPSNLAYARSSKEGLRCRAEFGRIRNEMAKMKGRREDYLNELVKLDLHPKAAVNCIKFAKRCVKYPRFLESGLGYTDLRELLPKIEEYFKSGSASIDAQDAHSELLWKGHEKIARSNSRIHPDIVLSISPPQASIARVTRSRWRIEAI